MSYRWLEGRVASRTRGIPAEPTISANSGAISTSRKISSRCSYSENESAVAHETSGRLLTKAGNSITLLSVPRSKRSNRLLTSQRKSLLSQAVHR